MLNCSVFLVMSPFSSFLIFLFLKITRPQYVGINDQYDINDARDQGQQQYETTLATIQNVDEDNEIKLMCTEYCGNWSSGNDDCSCWIGLYLAVDGTSWEWEDGSALNDSDYGSTLSTPIWKSGDPTASIGSNTNRVCVRIAYDEGNVAWADSKCIKFTGNDEHYPICNGTQLNYISLK